MTRRWEIPDEKVVALVANGVLGRMLRWMPDSWSPAFKSRVVKNV